MGRGVWVASRAAGVGAACPGSTVLCGGLAGHAAALVLRSWWGLEEPSSGLCFAAMPLLYLDKLCVSGNRNIHRHVLLC